jgi:integrase
MRGVYRRGGKWWIRYCSDDHLVRKSIGYDRRQAEEALATVRADIVRGEYKLKKKSEACTFKEMAAEYLKEKKYKRSVGEDRASLKRLLPEFRHRDLQQITAKHIEAYVRKRRNVVTGATINRELALLKCMFNVAIEKGYLESNPAKKIKREKEAPWRYQYIFSESEIQRLMNAAAPHLRPILLLAFGTGLRKGDILGLSWSNVDLARGTITLFMQKTGESIELPMLPMVKDVLLRMKQAAGDSAYVFTNPQSGKKMGSNKTAFNAALRRSGLAGKGYRFHDIRRTFATLLYNHGVSLIKIQRLLGHKSVTTTERYLGVKFEETKQAIMVLDSVLPSVECTITAQLPEAPSAIPLLSETS